jgi:hypothetical protein
MPNKNIKNTAGVIIKYPVRYSLQSRILRGVKKFWSFSFMAATKLINTISQQEICLDH